MNTVARLEVELDLDSGGFTGRLLNAGRQTELFRAQVDRTHGSIRNIESAVNGLGAKVRDLFVILGQTRAALHTLWAGTGQWVGSIIRANSELERLRVLMSGLSTQTSASGQMREAAEDLDYVLARAKQAPFSLNEIANSFVKMKSGGIDPTTGAMNALTNAVAAFGGDDQIFHRATIAIQQMAGKGVISMEELRQQLGEAVPSAMRLMAQSMNVSVGELVKRISLGRVEANDALRRMMNEMNVTFAGRAKAMMSTWTGLVSQLKTEWVIFANAVGDGGIYESAKQGLREIIALLKSREGLEFARSLGAGLKMVVDALITTTKFIIENRQEIAQWGQLLIGLFVGGKILGGIATLAGGLLSLRAYLASMSVTAIASSAALTSVGAASMVAQRGVWALAAAWTQGGVIGVTFTGILGGLRLALAAVGGPVGLIVTALGALALKAYDTAQKTKQARIEWEGFKNALVSDDGASDSQMQAAQARFQRVSMAINQFNEMRAKFRNGDASLLDFNVEGANPVNRLVRQLESEGELIREKGEQNIDALRRYWGKLRDEMSAAADQRAVNSASASARQWVESITGNVDTQLRQLGAERARIFNEMTVGDEETRISREEAAKRQVAAVTKTFNEILPALLEQRARLAEALSLPAATRGEDATQREQAAALETRIAELVRMRDEMIADANRGIVEIADFGSQSEETKKADKLKTFFESVTGRVEEMRAKIEDTAPELAKFEAMLSVGAYGASPDSGMVAQVRALLTEFDKLKEQRAGIKAVETAFGALDEMAAKVNADLASVRENVSGDVYSEATRGMAALNRQFAELALPIKDNQFELLALEAAFRKIREGQYQVDIESLTQRFREMADEAGDNALSNEDRRKAMFDREIARINASVAHLAKSEGDKTQLYAEAARLRANLQAEYDRASMTSWEVWIEDFRDISMEMNDVWRDAFDSMSQAIVNFARTGKLEFADMVADILAQILKLQTNQWIANMMMSMFGSAAGGGINAAVGGFGGPTAFAKGGVMTSAGPAPLPFRAYSKGGIANTPQLALFGEGSMPEAYVPLPDGRSIPVTMQGGGGSANVQVNVINQSGQQVEAEETGRRFDGEKLILDVVLSAAARPGKFRDSMKSAMR